MARNKPVEVAVTADPVELETSLTVHSKATPEAQAERAKTVQIDIDSFISKAALKKPVAAGFKEAMRLRGEDSLQFTMVDWQGIYFKFLNLPPEQFVKERP